MAQFISIASILLTYGEYLRTVLFPVVPANVAVMDVAANVAVMKRTPIPKTNVETAFACGMLIRHGSNTKKCSLQILAPEHGNFPYPIDTCQTVFLVEKTNGTYEVTILFTREYRKYWLDAKLNVILLRIFIAENNMPSLREMENWIIIGTIDCQPDRNKGQSGFHQDNMVYSFIPDVNGFNLATDLRALIDFMFPPLRNSVNSSTTAHIGILDYNSLIPIIAAAGRDDNGNYYFTVLPATDDFLRGYLFYLNSDVVHQTPVPINIDVVKDWYTEDDRRQTSANMGGFATLDHLIAALEEYNKFLYELDNYPRDFRRFLAKNLFNPSDDQKDMINLIKYEFYVNAYSRYVINTVPPVPPVPPLDPAQFAAAAAQTVFPVPHYHVQNVNFTRTIAKIVRHVSPLPAPAPHNFDVNTAEAEDISIKKRKDETQIDEPEPQINLDQYTYIVKKFTAEDVLNIKTGSSRNDRSITTQEQGTPLTAYQFKIPSGAFRPIHAGGKTRNKRSQRKTKKRKNEHCKKNRKTKHLKKKKRKTKKR